MSQFSSESIFESDRFEPLEPFMEKSRSNSTPSTSHENMSGSGSLADEVQSTSDYIPGTFEGPEKTMEVVFRSDRGPEEGLRLLTREQIDLLCTDARCTVVHHIKNQYIDSYVLSESSLFVYRHRLIMKTCGTTTLLRCLSRLFEYTDALGMEMAYLGYSRKNLTFPHAQDWVHQSFENEITYLSTHQKLENRLRGTAHILGPITGDHWFVYVADHVPTPATALLTPAIAEPGSPSAAPRLSPLMKANISSYNNLMTLTPSAGSNERTINLMMFDMAPEVSKIFYQSENGLTGREMTEKAGIHHLCPGAQIDEVAFTPCGYSMNAILHDAYSTIHITPEPECSYVSFETNTLLENYASLVRNVLSVFKPRRFVLTMFGDQTSINSISSLPTDAKQISLPLFGNFLRTSMSCTQVDLELGCLMACYSLDANSVIDRKARSPSTVSSVSGDGDNPVTLEDLPAPAVFTGVEKKERSYTWC